MAGLYIHIPFCGSRCAYCDFYSTTSPERVAAYIEALKREMSSRSKLSIINHRLSTVYVGGGTPSLLAPEQLQGLLDHAAKLWDCSSLSEVTLEANPEDLTGRRADGGFLSDLNRMEFNRLSIGIQSFDNGLLRLMNRRHDAASAKEAVRAAQKAGFDNISIDLIYGIPGMTEAQWERTLDEAVGLGVQHISAYHLTIEPGTVFGKINLIPVSEAESERQFEMLRRKLEGAGFEHYEISNFALPGRRAIHNSAYWSGEPYLGVGPSAHSFDGDRRREWVSPDIGRYIDAFSPPLSALRNDESSLTGIYEGETLTDRELRNERIMTSLRTAEGLPFFEMRTDPKIKKFLDRGLLVKKGDNIAIPPEKFLLSDYIVGELFET